MGRIILHENITPDGFCDHRAVIADPEMMHYVNELLENTDRALFGRVTFQLFESYWPSVWKNKTGPDTEIIFAGLMEKMEKIVLTKTIQQFNWINTRTLRELNKKDIHRLKEISVRDMIVFGSPNLASQLIQLGLVDEYHFFVQPFIFGKGGRLFNDRTLEPGLNLKLIKTKVFNSGTVALCYQP